MKNMKFGMVCLTVCCLGAGVLAGCGHQKETTKPKETVVKKEQQTFAIKNKTEQEVKSLFIKKVADQDYSANLLKQGLKNNKSYTFKNKDKLKDVAVKVVLVKDQKEQEYTFEKVNISKIKNSTLVFIDGKLTLQYLNKGDKKVKNVYAKTKEVPVTKEAPKPAPAPAKQEVVVQKAPQQTQQAAPVQKPAQQPAKPVEKKEPARPAKPKDTCIDNGLFN